MSLNVPLFAVIPEDTERVAKAAFPTGNRYMLLRDTFGPLFDSRDFQHLFSTEGRPAEDPARLALITILQFVERLSDGRRPMRCEADRLEVFTGAAPRRRRASTHPVLSEFRTRLLQGQRSRLLFEVLLTAFAIAGLLRRGGGSGRTRRMCWPTSAR